jgi:DNA-binding beta-propeller fold protein YncE
LGTAALGAAGLFAAPAVAAPAPAAATHAVFVQTDNPHGNAVVAYRSRANGTLVKAGTYRTGGLGGVLDGSVVDHLASQGGLALDAAHHRLYAVNAGSNTITVFAVHGTRLTKLQTLRSGGTFPVSIAVHGALVYVLNARNGGNVQGFLRSGGRLQRVAVWRRPLGLDPAATPEFVTTPGQVAFSPDGTQLVVTTKANSNAIEVFRVDGAHGPSARPVITTDTGNVPFAVSFTAANRLLVVEAGDNSVASYRLARSGAATLISRSATGQAASCWIARAGRHVYVSNAGSATVSSYYVSATGSPKREGTTATDAGTVDAAAAPGRPYLYVQTGAQGIVDEFRIGAHGTLARIGRVTVPGAAGGEGIVAD